MPSSDNSEGGFQSTREGTKIRGGLRNMANTTEGGTGMGPGENKIFFSL